MMSLNGVYFKLKYVPFNYTYMLINYTYRSNNLSIHQLINLWVKWAHILKVKKYLPGA